MDQEATVKSQRIALDEMKRDLMLLEKQTPMDSEQAEIAWTQAKGTSSTSRPSNFLSQPKPMSKA